MPWTLIAPFMQSVQHATPHTTMRPSSGSDGLHARFVASADHETLEHKYCIFTYDIFFFPFTCFKSTETESVIWDSNKGVS